MDAFNFELIASIKAEKNIWAELLPFLLINGDQAHIIIKKSGDEHLLFNSQTQQIQRGELPSGELLILKKTGGKIN